MSRCGLADECVTTLDECYMANSELIERSKSVRENRALEMHYADCLSARGDRISRMRADEIYAGLDRRYVTVIEEGYRVIFHAGSYDPRVGDLANELRSKGDA